MSTKQLLVSLLKSFYQKGWCSGTGGGLSIKFNQNVFYAPSGVSKEMLDENDIFMFDESDKLLSDVAGHKISECRPIFDEIYRLRPTTQCCIHSHSLNAVMVCELFRNSREFTISNYETIKGIRGLKYSDTCVVPIIDNTERESELVSSINDAIIRYPEAFGVLVDRHGFYCFGDSWQEAKKHAECYDYLFELVLKLQYHQRLSSTVVDYVHTHGQLSRLSVSQRIENNEDSSCLTCEIQIQGLSITEWLYNIAGICFFFDPKDYPWTDCLDITPDKINSQFLEFHKHSTDEVREVLDGSGIFEIVMPTTASESKPNSTIYCITVKKGIKIVIPKNITHRFLLDDSNFIRVNRYFQTANGWIPE